MGDKKEKKASKSEWNLIDMVIPLFAFLLAVYYYYTLLDLPAEAQYYGGTISILLIICFAAVVYIFFKKKVYLEFKTIKDNFIPNDEKKETPLVVAIELLCITLLYVGAIRLIGYTSATFLFLCAVMFFLGRRGIFRIILPAAIITVVGYILFIIILNLNISLDPVSRTLKYLIRGWIF